MLLDTYIPTYEFNEIHTVRIQNTPEKVFKALKELTTQEWSPLVQLLFNIRNLPATLIGKSGENFQETKPILEQLTQGGFVILEEQEDQEIVFGLIGQFWKLTGNESPRLSSSQEFLAFNDPNYARAIANFYLAETDYGVQVSTETRIHIPDPKARNKFRLYWLIIKPGSAIIRRLWLRAIRRKAEGM